MVKVNRATEVRAVLGRTKDQQTRLIEELMKVKIVDDKPCKVNLFYR